METAAPVSDMVTVSPPVPLVVPMESQIPAVPPVGVAQAMALVQDPLGVRVTRKVPTGVPNAAAVPEVVASVQVCVPDGFETERITGVTVRFTVIVFGLARTPALPVITMVHAPEVAPPLPVKLSVIVSPAPAPVCPGDTLAIWHQL